MKKRIIISMAACFLTFSSIFAGTRGDDVPQNIASDFSSHFYHAQNVKWEKMDSYYEVTFSQFGSTMFAFYSENADFMGIANYIPTGNLPELLSHELKTKYGNYWISDLFRYLVNDQPGYCVTIENGDQKIMLKSEGSKNWILYKSVKKS
jgi:hypothetical protein